MGWDKASGDETCCECDSELESGEDIFVATSANGEIYCEGCYDDMSDNEQGMYDNLDEDLIDGVGFADPHGHSALRAATPNNPRDQSCPTCGTPNVLTRIDRKRGYQCDSCADRDERGGY